MGIFDRTGLTKKITRQRLRAFLERYRSDAKTLDIGCGTALYGDLFPNRTTLDIAPRTDVPVDLVADAHDLSAIKDATFDVILCTEVLEHLHTPHQAIAEMRRVIKPGGLLILSTRFVFPLHDVPGDFYRYTKYGLRHLLRDFDILELREETSTIETLAVLCQRIGFQCDTLGWRGFKVFWFLKAKILMLFSWILTKEHGDLSHKQPEKNILSSGYYVAAKK